MSEGIVIALVSGGSAIAGAALSAFVTAAKNKLDAYRLAQQMQADNQLLWQWNRQLVDHIYKQLAPPPPDPPAALFDHDS